MLALLVTCMVVGWQGAGGEGEGQAVAVERPEWRSQPAVSVAYVSELVRPGARLGFDVGLVGVERRRRIHELFVGASLGTYVFPRSYALAWAGGEIGYRRVSRRNAMFEVYTGLHGGVRPNWGTTYGFAASGQIERQTGVAAQFLPTLGWGVGQDFRRQTDGVPLGWFVRMYAMLRVPHNSTLAPLLMFELGIRLDPRGRQRRSSVG